jgi:hypothetical protein
MHHNVFCQSGISQGGYVLSHIYDDTKLVPDINQREEGNVSVDVKRSIGRRDLGLGYHGHRDVVALEELQHFKFFRASRKILCIPGHYFQS